MYILYQMHTKSGDNNIQAHHPIYIISFFVLYCGWNFDIYFLQIVMSIIFT